VTAVLSRPTGLVVDHLGRRWPSTLLVIVVGAALVSLSAQVDVPNSGPVPGTLQPLAVLLVGGLLGAWRGAAAVALYLLAGAVGLPVFAGGTSGFGPTVGYLVGFVLAAFIVGAVSERSAAMPLGRRAVILLLGMVAGVAVLYALGLIVLAAQLGLDASAALDAGFTPFIGGDLVELLVAWVVALAVQALSRKASAST
jgi:biotin transport system substrate-specific component